MTIYHKNKIYFSKMQGLGNDFIILDCTKKKFFLSFHQIKQLSNRYTGIGFDQLLLVEKPKDNFFDFHYRIFNSNGMEVEQCGNGARCFGLFVQMKKLTKKKIIFVSTKSGLLKIKILSNNLVQVNMNKPDFQINDLLIKKIFLKNNYFIDLNPEKIICHLVSIGNPHCIIKVQSIQNAPVNKIGRKIEKNSIFSNGINVGFMHIIDKNHIKLRVYERGTGETKACGSGACAAVAVGIFQKLLSHTVLVDLPGGSLTITWKGLDYPLHMIGPAQHVYDGHIYI